MKLSSPCLYRILSTSLWAVLSSLSLFGGQPDKTPPNAPVNLAANGVTCSQVYLSWLASADVNNSATVSGLKGYNVFRNGTLLQQVLAPATSFTDSSVTVSASYTYGVSAVDNAGNASITNTLVLTIPLCADTTPPNVPASPSARASGCSQVNVSWTAVTDRSNPTQQLSGVKGYNVYRNGAWVTFTTSLSATDTGLSGNSAYSYQVSAVDNANNESGLSVAAGVNTAVCLDTTAPSVPVGLTVTGLSCSEISLSWAQSTDTAISGQQASGLKGYNVYRNGFLLLFTSGQSLTDPNVTASAVYYYRISAVDNANNESGPSAPLNVPTPACPALAADNLKISVSNGKAQLQWSGAAGARYQLECATNPVGPWAPVDAPSTASSVATLASQPSCLYRVALFTNTPAYLANYSANINDTTPPTAPTSLSLTLAPSQVALAWAPSIDIGTSGLDRYLIYRDGTFLKSATTTTSSDTSVSPGSQYTYGVAAIDKAGNVSGTADATITIATNCISLLPASTDAGPDATNGWFVVDATGCSWSASVSAADAWIQLQGPTSGSGSANINYSIADNTGVSDRTGTILVQNKTYTITQKGRKCTYSLSPGSFNHGAAASNGSFSVNATAGCSWTAATSDAWIHTSTSGSGSGTVNYSVDSNGSTAPRSGTISAGGQVFTVNQAAASCTYSLNPANNSLSAGSSSGSFSVTAPTGCGWTATPGSSWIHSLTSGSGSGIVGYDVDANTGSSSRSGTINVGGQPFTVTQAGVAGCTYALAPTSSTISAAATAGSITVTAGTGCIWSASTTNSWLHATTSGVGNGTVTYSVDANAGTSSRVGVITVAGQTFTVNQGGSACSYTLASSGAGFTSAVGSSNVAVTAGSGCSWSASSGAAWLTITAGASGTGNGSVSYTLTANTSASARAGTLTIAGQSYNVTQNGNQPPVANAGPDLSITIGANATFSAAGSVDPDGSISSYQWNFGDGNTGSGSSVTHAYSLLGLYTVTLTVTDNLGATDTDTALITTLALPDTTPPTVSMTAPAAGSTVSNTIILSANASDNSGGSGVARVEFYCDSVTTPLGTATTAPYTYNCDTTAMANGNHSFYAKAYDVAGNFRNSVTNNVNVNNAIQPPGVWARRYGGIGNDNGSAVAVDASGNILMAGFFKGTADFGGNLLTSAGGADIILAKYNNAGVHQWSYRFGGTGDETVKAIALDASGNIFIAGYFTGSANLGGATFTSAGQYNAFVAKYSSTGQHLWSKSFGSTGSTTYIDLFNGLVVDSQGNVVVTGTFQGDATFGGATLHSLWGTAVNIVLAKYATDGTHLWSKTFVNANDNYANGIAIDSSDNILLTGSFYSSVNFASNDGLDRTITAVYPTYQNIFVAKFTKDGANVWAKRFGGPKGDKGISVAVDGNGDVIVGGMFYKQTDLGNGTITGGALDLDSFVAKYSGADGSYRWAVPIVGDNGCWVNAVDSDAQNNVVLTGFFYGTFAFGGQTLSSTLNSYDGYVAKYSSSGGLTWATGFGGPGSDGSSAIAIDGTSHPIVTGAFNGTAIMGGTTLVSAGTGDAFLMRLNP